MVSRGFYPLCHQVARKMWQMNSDIKQVKQGILQMVTIFIVKHSATECSSACYLCQFLHSLPHFHSLYPHSFLFTICCGLVNEWTSELFQTHLVMSSDICMLNCNLSSFLANCLYLPLQHICALSIETLHDWCHDKGNAAFHCTQKQSPTH